MTTYGFDPDESRLVIRARSSVHPINTDANGVNGSVDLVVHDGTIDLGQPVAASLRFELARLSSGNPLYDRETERRIEVKRHPYVDASVTAIELIGPDPDTPGAQRYRVTGDLTFHGVTQSLDGEIGVRVVSDGIIQLWGEQVIDVRAWKINPPRIGLLKVYPEVRVRLEVTARC